DAQVYRIVAAVVRHHLAVRVTAGNAKGKEVVARRAVDIEAARDHAVAAQRIAKPGHLAVGAVHRQPLLGLEGDAEDGAHHRLVQPAAYVAGHAASRADLLRIGLATGEHGEVGDFRATVAPAVLVRVVQRTRFEKRFAARAEFRIELLQLPGENGVPAFVRFGQGSRSEEHTSELQSRENLVCRLLLEKKKT